MQAYPSAVAAQLAARTGVRIRLLLWITARDRDTGLPESIGFWTGDDNQTFSIGGVSRDYLGAGAMLAVDPIVHQTGLVIRNLTVSLSPLSEAVALAMRGYDPRLAPAEIHQAFFDPATHLLLANPVRVFRGWVNEVEITTPEIGGDAACRVLLASNSQILTRKLPAKKSDASHQKRFSGDTFMQYADVSGTVPIAWGEKLATVDASTPAAPATSHDPRRGSDR